MTSSGEESSHACATAPYAIWMPAAFSPAMTVHAPICLPLVTRAQANPLAAADDAAAPRRGVAHGGDGQADGAAKLDAVGALVEIDQHGQRVGGAGVLPRRTRDGLGRLACDLAGGGVEADGGADLAEVAGKDPA